MSPLARRRGLVIVLVVMLMLAIVSLGRVASGREGSWVTAGTALAVAVGSLSQLSTSTSSGSRRPVTARGKLLVLGLSISTAACLIVGGVTSRDAFMWVIISIFLVGVAATVIGTLRSADPAASGPA